MKNQYLVPWSFSGETLPEGSYITSSLITNLDSESADYNTSVEVSTTDGQTFYVSLKHFLVYESGSNRWTFKQPKNLTGLT